MRSECAIHSICLFPYFSHQSHAVLEIDLIRSSHLSGVNITHTEVVNHINHGNCPFGYRKHYSYFTDLKLFWNGVLNCHLQKLTISTFIRCYKTEMAILAAAAVPRMKTRILLKTIYRKTLLLPRTAKILRQLRLLPLHQEAVQAKLNCF